MYFLFFVICVQVYGLCGCSNSTSTVYFMLLLVHFVQQRLSGAVLEPILLHAAYCRVTASNVFTANFFDVVRRRLMFSFFMD